MTDSPVVLLPHPDSPTIPTHSPSDDLEGDAVHGHHGTCSHVEFGAEVLQLEDRTRHHRSVLGRPPGSPGGGFRQGSGQGAPGRGTPATPATRPSPRFGAQTVRPACIRSVASTYSSTMEKTTSLALRTAVARPMTWPQGLKFTSLAASG